MKITVAGTRGIPRIMGGVETHCGELFPRVVSLGFDVTLIRRLKYVKDELKEYEGVKLLDVKTSQNKNFEAILHTLKAVFIAKFKIKTDILHIHAIGPALLIPFARLLGLKVVFTHHGHDYDRAKWGWLAKKMLKFGEMMGCLFANEVIVISKTIQNNIQRLYHRMDAHLIYNGAPSPLFVNGTSYLDELGIESKKYILAVGRFVPEKNFHLLIQAFSKVNQKKCKLVLVGASDYPDEYSKRLVESARESGVVLTGFLKGEKLNELFTHARLFVLPSAHEGLPIALLEAMSYGLDILASDILANKELSLPKESYFHIDSDAAENLFTALQKKIMQQELKKTYDLTCYDWDVIVAQTSRVYEKIDKRHREMRWLAT